MKVALIPKKQAANPSYEITMFNQKRKCRLKIAINRSVPTSVDTSRQYFGDGQTTLTALTFRQARNQPMLVDCSI